MGPHPKPLRRVITLAKAPVAILVQKPANGPKTVASADRVGEALQPRQPGSLASGLPTAAWAARKLTRTQDLVWLTAGVARRGSASKPFLWRSASVEIDLAGGEARRGQAPGAQRCVEVARRGSIALSKTRSLPPSATRVSLDGHHG